MTDRGVRLQTQIIRDVLSAYGSLDAPSWGFAEKRRDLRPYEGLIAGFSELARTEITTDLNDDWAEVVSIDLDGRRLCIRLSLVGPYCCIHDAQGNWMVSVDIEASEGASG